MDEIRKMYIEACKEVDDIKAKIGRAMTKLKSLASSLNSTALRMIAESLDLMETLL